MKMAQIYKLQLETNSLSQLEWNDYVNQHPQSTFYHKYEWGSILKNSLGYQPYYLSAKEEGKVVGILPLLYQNTMLLGKKLFSLPVVDYGGILANSKEVETQLAEEAKRLAQKLQVRYLLLRHFEEKPLTEFTTTQSKVTFFYDLDRSEEEMWKGFKGGSVRTPVRKAQKEGYQARWGKKELLDDFYKVFQANMHYHGTPVYPKAFFAQTLETFPQEVDILVIYHQDRPVATAMVYSYNGKSESPWAGSVLDTPIRPNDFMYWEILLFTKNKGSKVFDFGRSSPGCGTYKFKSKWTKDVRPLHWQYYLVTEEEVSEQGSGRFFQNAIYYWKKLPPFAANFLGPLVSHIIV